MYITEDPLYIYSIHVQYILTYTRLIHGMHIVLLLLLLLQQFSRTHVKRSRTCVVAFYMNNMNNRKRINDLIKQKIIFIIHLYVFRKNVGAEDVLFVQPKYDDHVNHMAITMLSSTK